MSKAVDRKAPEFSELPFGWAYPSESVCVCVSVRVYMHVCVRARGGWERGWLRCVSCVAVYCFLEQEKWAYVTVM